jgi:hypothetical protein
MGNNDDKCQNMTRFKQAAHKIFALFPLRKTAGKREFMLAFCRRQRPGCQAAMLLSFTRRERIVTHSRMLRLAVL